MPQVYFSSIEMYSPLTFHKIIDTHRVQVYHLSVRFQIENLILYLSFPFFGGGVGRLFFSNDLSYLLTF